MNHTVLRLINYAWTRTTLIAICVSLQTPVRGDNLPHLPERNAEVAIPAQEWPLRPGPRTIALQIQYPNESLNKVSKSSGLMLTLHNWGGTKAVGTADPRMLSDRYDVIAISLDYLQSGASDPTAVPYDFGYLQALDALRALHFVFAGLQNQSVPFDCSRIYAVGGSGGGNVALMCNKLAPRTFACVVDMSGMAKLNDDIAFNLPGGSSLNAGYSQDASSSTYLSPDAQAIRFIGNPAHLATMRQLGNVAKVVVVHGEDDPLCAVADARELVANMQKAGFDVAPHFISQADIDGKVFLDSGHSLGDRSQIVRKVADQFLLPNNAAAKPRPTKCDFELRDSRVQYATPHGHFIVSYEQGFPVGYFEPIKNDDETKADSTK